MVRWKYPFIWFCLAIMNSSINMHNTCRLILEKDDVIVGEIINENITCDAWRISLLKRLYDDSTAGLWKIKYIAVGVATQTPSVGLTQLSNESIRAEIDSARTTTAWTQIKVYARFGIGTSLTVTEAGVFTDASATLSPNTGSLLCYSTWWTPIVKPTDQVLTIEWTININNATV